MSRKTPSSGSSRRRSHAPVFAALGDRTRLALLAKLSEGELHSISQLTQGSRLTRQAITKHLRALEQVQLVRSERSGRECLWQLQAHRLDEVRGHLDQICGHWDQALERLRGMVESTP